MICGALLWWRRRLAHDQTSDPVDPALDGSRHLVLRRRRSFGSLRRRLVSDAVGLYRCKSVANLPKQRGDLVELEVPADDLASHEEHEQDHDQVDDYSRSL